MSNFDIPSLSELEGEISADEMIDSELSDFDENAADFDDSTSPKLYVYIESGSDCDYCALRDGEILEESELDDFKSHDNCECTTEPSDDNEDCSPEEIKALKIEIRDLEGALNDAFSDVKDYYSELEEAVENHNNSYLNTADLHDVISNDGFSYEDVQAYITSHSSTIINYETCEFIASIYNLSFEIADEILIDLKGKKSELDGCE